MRLTLLRRLASSAPALLESLERLQAYCDLARDAAAQNRRLAPSDFQRLFPRRDAPELQLALFPMLLEAGPVGEQVESHAIAGLRALLAVRVDPKLEALTQVLDGARTIVFVEARATARYLLRQLAGRVRVAAVTGPAGLFGVERVTREEVLRAFAPVARGAPAPVAALQTDVLIATDLLSEGLNLQDAARVIHYDLPWSPARLAQRVGRIDRLGSPHSSIETVAFLPPPTLAAALTTERRLARKIATQRAVGAAQIETLDGARIQPGRLDWCDRLQRLADPEPAAGGAVTAACDGGPDGTVLIVAIGDLVETIVIDGAGVRPYPAAATELCERALLAEPRSCDRGVLQSAIERAAPLIRSRLAAIAAARWRGADRDRLSRRLVPWVLTEAKRAARRRDQRTLTRIDRLIGRLVAGMTAGEELSLAELLEARQSLRIDRLLDWHASLPAAVERDSPGGATLIAAVQLRSD